jgi:hypothetical protein
MAKKGHERAKSPSSLVSESVASEQVKGLLQAAKSVVLLEMQ